MSKPRNRKTCDPGRRIHDKTGKENPRTKGEGYPKMKAVQLG